MPAQRRGRRDAQDIIETIGSTPVEDFGTAIMAIGAQQYLGVGPVGPDRPQQAAQEGANLLATRPFGGAKHSRDEAAFAVEHDNRLETVFVVMRIEQRVSGTFSSREMVDCEHSSRSDGDRSSAILNIGSTRRPLASLPSS